MRDLLSKVGDAIVATNNERVIWCGDFNVIMNPVKDTNSSVRGLQNHDKHVIAALEAWDLTDVWRTLHPCEHRFTCFTRSAASLARIDHFMASPSFMNPCP